MQSSIRINHKKLVQQIATIDNLAIKNKWSFIYDKNLDSLYYSPKKITSGYILYSVNDEYSIYIDKNSNLGGVFIEYYKSNLASHDIKFKDFKNIFTEKIDGFNTIPANKLNKAEDLKEVLKAEILSELVLSGNKKVTLAL